MDKTNPLILLTIGIIGFGFVGYLAYYELKKEKRKGDEKNE